MAKNRFSILHTDVLAAFKTMPDNSYHGCLTDPPYGLSFMGHGWDHGVPSVDVWRELLRVLRPGAHVLAFGGTRTFHRLTCAIEDAGFEIRDCMMWLYGSGFPKSHDVSKAIDREAGAVREVIGPSRANIRADLKYGGNDPAHNHGRLGAVTHPPITAPATDLARQWEGHGTALKPAWEPIIVARKPLDGTVAQNVQRWGCGGLAIDACRVGTSKDVPASPSGVVGVYQNGHKSLSERSGMDPNVGRWPANVILDEEAGAALDVQSGTLRNGGQNATSRSHSARGASGLDSLSKGTARPGDSGGASRFFYQAKASKAERNAGVEANVHPTVKPLALARYLARLILPPIPDARMVVPFCGSGSEVIGALQAGWSHVDGIDSWDVAVDIARARVKHWNKPVEQLDLTGEE